LPIETHPPNAKANTYNRKLNKYIQQFWFRQSEFAPTVAQTLPSLAFPQGFGDGKKQVENKKNRLTNPQKFSTFIRIMVFTPELYPLGFDRCG
jgi:hypothetical protein